MANILTYTHINRKKDEHDHKTTSVDKPINEPRLVVQTRSEVDIVNDGHRWRKYGQKIVKGSPHPRFVSFSMLTDCQNLC